MVYIENISTDKVLGVRHPSRNYVVPQDLDQNKTSQLWEKVEANDEDYFKLVTRVNGLQFLTAKSTYELKVDRGM